MTNTIVQLGLDFLQHDFTPCHGALDYIINDCNHSIDRVIQFLISVYKINELQALEVLEFCGLVKIN